ncbi:MAG: hypothetical protein IPK57_15640 [Chitinophagaceae bacterium]|nr:hypothetical protein [Chitinophagaceae bacterium]
MGDAVAIYLMQLNGFNRKIFAKEISPLGGSLEKKLYLRVADLYAADNENLKY